MRRQRRAGEKSVHASPIGSNTVSRLPPLFRVCRFETRKKQETRHDSVRRSEQFWKRGHWNAERPLKLRNATDDLIRVIVQFRAAWFVPEPQVHTSTMPRICNLRCCEFCFSYWVTKSDRRSEAVSAFASMSPDSTTERLSASGPRVPPAVSASHVCRESLHYARDRFGLCSG